MSKQNTVRRARRIGIYAGTFDPVHAGHIAFALQAIEQAQLDEVVFLPERRPRFKPDAEHFGHRVAMLNRAVKPHRQLSVREMVDARFSVKRTLTQLKIAYPKSRLVLLAGSDVTTHMLSWADVDQLFASTELVIGARSGASERIVDEAIKAWPIAPRRVHIFESHAPQISSHSVREAIRNRHHQEGVLASVVAYASRNWLYVSLPKYS